MNEEETGLELEKKESRQKWVRGRQIETEREREENLYNPRVIIFSHLK